MKIHIFHTGKVHVSPYLPFGGEKSHILRSAGITVPKRDWLWLPVSAYLIEHTNGKKLLVDTGWHRDMSPEGKYNPWAQIRSLGTPILYMTNQGVLPMGEAIDEQLQSQFGLQPQDLDYVLLTHLDCDHTNGLKLVRDAKRILVSEDEMKGAAFWKGNAPIRYQKRWWSGTRIETFRWNNTEGPVGKSFDLFGDGSIEMICIPGHSAGLCAVKVKAEDGRFVLLCSDGGYSERSWREMILPGISTDKMMQRTSLAWIREQSLSPNCMAVLANHDPNVRPGTIEFAY